MKHNFMLNTAGGFLTPLPERSRHELESRVPGLPTDAVQREYSFYLMEREAKEGQPPAREIKKKAGEFQKMVSELLAVAEPLRKNNLGTIIDAEASIRGHPGTLDGLIKSLTVLKLTLPYAMRQLPEGHSVNDRHLLVMRLLPLLEQAGLSIDERPNGTLCQVVAIILDAAGEAPSNIVSIVRPVLRALKKTDRN